MAIEDISEDADQEDQVDELLLELAAMNHNYISRGLNRQNQRFAVVSRDEDKYELHITFHKSLTDACRKYPELRNDIGKSMFHADIAKRNHFPACVYDASDITQLQKINGYMLDGIQAWKNALAQEDRPNRRVA